MPTLSTHDIAAAMLMLLSRMNPAAAIPLLGKEQSIASMLDQLFTERPDAVDAAQDTLSGLLEDPHADNERIRDAAVTLCAALNTARHAVKAPKPKTYYSHHEKSDAEHFESAVFRVAQEFLEGDDVIFFGMIARLVRLRTAERYEHDGSYVHNDALPPEILQPILRLLD